MLINSVFGLLVPLSAHWGYGWLIAVRFIQGLGEVSKLPKGLRLNVINDENERDAKKKSVKSECDEPEWEFKKKTGK